MLGLFNRKQKFRQTPQTLLNPTGSGVYFFGSSVALSSDGNTAIVGASGANVGSNANQGRATIFTRSGSTWTQQQIISQLIGAASDSFGVSVALSSNGNTAIVGAPYDDVASNINQGSATIFTRSGSTWTEQQIVTQSTGAQNDYFGQSVALSADGNTAIVGAYADDVVSNANQGSASVFTRSGGIWSQQQTITQTGAVGADDYFGMSVALSSDGNTAIVGAPGFDGPLAGNQGSAIIFTRSGGVWTQQQALTQTGGSGNDSFGQSVALSSDGNTALVGANGDNSFRGSATIFVRSGGVWTQQQTITQSTGAANDEFGISVALSTDGNTAIVGTPGDDVGSNFNQGSVTIFTRLGSVWTQQNTITQTSGANGSNFGNIVSISGNGKIAIGGAYADNSSQGSATIIYRR